MTPESRKVALVTGCSEPSSLGAAISLDLLHRGFRVYATARKVSSMKELEKEGCDVRAFPRYRSV
jgi:NADP-dependent 3-hydroxy acid dehydrogenase YdfG